MPVAVRELELDLDAFEGPFDLLLSLVLREELPLKAVDLAYGTSLSADLAVPRPLALAASPPHPARLRPGGGGALARGGGRRLPGAARIAQAERDRACPVRPVRTDKDFARRRRKESLM